MGKHYMLINGDAAETNETIRDIVSETENADIIIPYFGKNDTRVLFRRVLSITFTFLVNLLSGNILFITIPIAPSLLCIMR